MSDAILPDGQFFVTGGTMRPGADSYVVRKADGELLNAALAGEFCYVLTPRQMGKSSMMTRTARKLADAGIRSAQIDLSQVGADKRSVTAEQWYYGVAFRIVRELRISVPLDSWWKERGMLSAAQKFTEFLREIVLENCSSQVVIFVDEIDSTIGLPFADDFFAGIRACYNERAKTPAFERLSFVLLGVATPAQLISDPTRTPFNIGRGIELGDFTMEEAAQLAKGLDQGLDPDTVRAGALLERVLYWTGGHPYLTQALCRAIAEHSGTSVDQLVAEKFLSAGAAKEEANLKFVRGRLTQSGADLRRVLRTYRRVALGKAVEDAPASTVYAALKLSGVVKPGDDGLLHVRNPIYSRVFSAEWARRETPSDKQRYLLAASMLVCVAAFGLWYSIFQPRPFVKTLRTFSADDTFAYQAYDDLRKNILWRNEAENLFALYWARRQERDYTLAARLRSLTRSPDRGIRKEVADLIGADYPGLVSSLRHGDRVYAVAFSPDGKTVLTGSRDNTARLWRADRGAPIGSPLQHQASVDAVAFSPDGKTVLTGSLDNTARLWRADSGAPIGAPLQHQASVDAVAFSPDGKTVLTGSLDNTARLWRADSGAPIGSPLQHQDRVYAVAFSPDGKTVLTGSVDKTARLWRADSGAPIGSPLQHQAGVSAVAFSPDGKTVLTGSGDHTARLWRADSGAPIGAPLQHRSSVDAVAFSPDGKTVLTGSGDHTARLWRADSGAPIGSRLQHQDSVDAVAFSPDGKTVLTGSRDNTARLWRADSGAPIGSPLQHQARVYAVAFSTDGKTVLTGSGDKTARLWRADRGAPIGSPLQHQAIVDAVAFSPDGKTVLTGSLDNTARLWRADSGAPIGSPLQHQAIVSAVAFSPDGKTVLTGSGDNTVRLWRADSGAPIGSPLQHQAIVYAVAFSPDGKTVLTGSWDKTARLWRADSGAPIGSPLQHQDSVDAVAFSPDGKTVLTGSGDKTARLWRADSGAPIGSPLRHQAFVYAVAFSPDGKTVLTGSGDKTARLWRADSGAPIGSPLRHQDSVSAVAFSPDGKTVLTGSGDNTVRLWRADSGAPIGSPLQHQDSVDAVAFSPDGKTVLTGSGQWLYAWSSQGDTITSARLLRGGWTGALHFLDPSGHRLEVVLLDTGNSGFVTTIDFDRPESIPIQGDSRFLLSEWMRKLALTFNESGRIVPPYPVSTPQPPERGIPAPR